MVDIGTPLWPLSPNWREPYSVTYDFKTDVFTSRSGREQRRAQRSTPRKTLKFTVTRTGADARMFRRLLTTRQAEPLQAADLSRLVRAAETATAGDSIITIDRDVPDWADGAQTVAIGTRSYQLVQIGAVDGATLTLVAPLTVDVPAGTPLHPVVPGRIDAATSVKDYTSQTLEADVAFTVEPGRSVPDQQLGPIEVFNRREVFVFDPNRAQPVQGDFRRYIDQVDFGRGRVETFLPVAFSTRTKQFQMLSPTAADRERMVGLFLRMKGQRGEFYVPTFEDDFDVAVPAVGGTLTATFTGTGIDEVYQSDNTHRAVMITAANGTRFYRRIVASAQTGGNTTLTTDIGWPCPIDASARVQWLVANRFSVDQLTVECVTDEVSQIQYSVSSLEDLPVAGLDTALYDDIDGAGQWVIDNWGMMFFDDVSDKIDVIVNYTYPYSVMFGLETMHYWDSHLSSYLHQYQITTVGGVTYS